MKMKIVTRIITTFALVLLLINLLYIKIFNTMYVNQILYRIILILGLVLVFKIRNKITWFIGLVLFIYGLVDIYYLNIESAEPAVSNFMSPYFNLFFRGQFDSTLDMIPTFFYIFSIGYYMVDYQLVFPLQNKEST